MEWEKWIDLFAVAMMAKYSISMNELTRTADETNPRVKALLGDMPEKAANKKVVSMMFQSLGESGRKMFRDKYTETSIWTLQATDMLNNCHSCFHIERNRTLDRHNFLSRKQLPTESLQQFWHALNGLAARCELGEITQTLVHDVFILNMNKKKVQERLCVEPFANPADALQYAISYEEGLRRQKSIGTSVTEQPKAIKSEPVFAIERNKNKRECYRCGPNNFTMDHLKKCVAKNHQCEIYSVTGHLEKCCNQKYPQRKKEMQQRMKNKRFETKRVNYVSEEETEEEELDDDEMVLQVDGDGKSPFMIEGLLCGNEFKAIIDTGSPVSIFPIDELQRIVGKRKVVVRDMINNERYVDFNKKPLPLLGYMFVSVQVKGIRVSKARVLVAKRGTKAIVGRDWLTALRYKIGHSTEEGENSINCVSADKAISVEELSAEVKQLAEEFLNLFERRGCINNYSIKIEMKENARVTQQKGRRIPIQLQKQVDQEINNLLEQSHIEKADSTKDDVFIQPVVITVKKDGSIKIALDARALNDSIAKDEYQMPNLENLLDMVAGKIEGEKGEVIYSSVDLKYAYGQVPLHESTAKHCNFQKVGGKSTGTYRFITGHYGLTIMPTEFQKVMDLTLVNIDCTFVYIDDILIVTKGDKNVHMQKVREVMKVLDRASVQLKVDKCKIACKKIEWLGYELTGSGISPVNGKIQGITERLRPTNLKELRSFLGAVNQLNKFVPELATICFPFRSILKKNVTWAWTKEHEEAFLKINQEIKKITELTHFKRDSPIRIICDASKKGLGAVLQQQQNNKEWKPIYFASRFLTEFETKYSINELEFLAVVWAIEHFKNYVNGTKFKVISDHKALSSVLRPNRGNKTFSSRLTRWVDRLLLFDFEVTHAPGRVLGFADYLSRHPSDLEGSTIQAEQLWKEWFTVNVLSQIDAISVNEAKPMVEQKGKVLTRTRESVLKVESESENERQSSGENAKQRQPIKSKHSQNKNETIKSTGAYNPLNGQVDSESMFTSINKINESFLPANYEADKNLQKVINLVKTREGGKISRLPSPCAKRLIP